LHKPFTAGNASLVVIAHGCALKQTLAQCKIFLERTLSSTTTIKAKGARSWQESTQKQFAQSDTSTWLPRQYC